MTTPVHAFRLTGTIILMSVRESATPDPSQWPQPSVLKVPLVEAQAQLTHLVAVGQRLQDEAIRAQDPALFIGRVDEWRRHGRQWLDTNIGGQAAEEYKSVSDYTAEYAWDAILWESPGNPRRRSRDIASEIHVLESIAQRLPEWLPSGSTTPSGSSTAPPGQSVPSNANSPEKDPRQGPALAANRQAVMVIYGHDSLANRAMFDWLRSIGLEPREWSQLVESTGQANPYIGDVLTHAFQSVQAVVAFFTPDEHVRGRGALRGTSKTWRFQACPNVLIEAGMALITHPDRTVFVTLGPPELPSDLAGRHYVRLDGTPGPLNDLANRLEKAGCDVNRRGTQWTDPKIFPRRDKIASQPRQI